jgi:hypothetical protein
MYTYPYLSAFSLIRHGLQLNGDKSETSGRFLGILAAFVFNSCILVIVNTG